MFEERSGAMSYILSISTPLVVVVAAAAANCHGQKNFDLSDSLVSALACDCICRIVNRLQATRLSRGLYLVSYIRSSCSSLRLCRITHSLS